MSVAIKAIETIYNGYLFRSRLEARWAVFFDALGIKYQYEHEGYQTPHGYYLPDFWLPETETCIEIKPASYEPNGEIAWPDLDPRWDYVAKHYGFVIICGAPGAVTALYGGDNSYQGFVYGDYSYYWTECPYCGCIDINFDGRSARNRNHKTDCKAMTGDKGYAFDSPRLLKAYNIARQARFERESAVNDYFNSGFRNIQQYRTKKIRRLPVC